MTESDRPRATGHRRYWLVLVATLIATFSLLGFMGREIYRQAPPIPERIVSESGRLLFTSDDILQGQLVWQSTGGQQLGSVWGHGAYQAPDWTADWLHREALALLEVWAQREHGRSLEQVSAAERVALEARLPGELRTNRYDERSGTLTLGEDRVAALQAPLAHYAALFGSDPALTALRGAYAMQEGVVPDAVRREKLGAFFFWTSWSAVTNRPGLNISYTNNWPHEP